MYEIHWEGSGGVYTVGSPTIDKEGNHRWVAISDHNTNEEAINQIHYLNGGISQEEVRKIIAEKCNEMEIRLKNTIQLALHD